MSRIDEALRRAHMDQVADTRDIAASAGDVALRWSHELTLDQFARERPLSSSRGDRAGRGDGKPSIVAELPIVSTGRVAPAETASERKQIVRGGPVLIEQYHRVAAVLDNAQAARGLKRLMVTSALPREGRTSTVVNLALVLSESYARRVLLIDADLRQPSLHGIFGVRSEPGLGEALHGSRQGLPVIEVSPLLSVLPAGQPGEDPLRALASDRMCAVLDECANRFDWVLLDTPPLTLLTDAPLLARRAQAVVFVIGVGSAPFSVAEKAMTALGRASIIGTVLNGLEDRSEQARD